MMQLRVRKYFWWNQTDEEVLILIKYFVNGWSEWKTPVKSFVELISLKYKNMNTDNTWQSVKTS